MYLTKITVDGITVASKHLYDEYRWKQELCKSVNPNELKEWACRFLVKELSGEEIVYFLSQEQPKILPYGTWETKQISESFYENKKYYFEVLANPTVKNVVFDKDGKRKRQGKRNAVHPDKYEDWVKRKLTEGGCEVNNLSVCSKGMQICYRKGAKVSSIAVQYKGILNVKDENSFKRIAKVGIGHGRAFGLGLILLKKI